MTHVATSDDAGPPASNRSRLPDLMIHAVRRLPEKRLLAIVLAVGAVLRLVWVVYAAREPVGLTDPSTYLFYGTRLAEGDGYTHLGDGPTAYFPVGYPAVLGALVWAIRQIGLGGDLPLAAGVLNAMLGSVTIALVYVIGRRLAGGRVGITSAGIVAVFPGLVLQTGVILSETLFTALAMAAVAVLITGDPADRWPLGRPRLLGFGALVGAAALVRPISLLFLVALPAALWIAGPGGRAAARAAAIALAATLLVTAPWIVRNITAFDAPVFISNNLGDDLCIGHNPEAYGGGGHFAACQAPRPGSPSEAELARNRVNTRRALQYVIENPGHELGMVPTRVKLLVVHDHDGLLAAESYGDDPFVPPGLRDGLATLADLYFYAVLALAVAGLPSLVQRGPRRLFVLLALLSMALVPLAFFSNPRFHTPAMPLASIAAAFGAARLTSLVETSVRGTDTTR